MMNRIGWTASVLLAVAAGCETPPTKYDEMAYEKAVAESGFKVVKVVDSSTFLIDWSGTGDPRNFVPIKLLGVDAPEAVGFMESHGATAAAYLEKLIKGKNVTILLDTDGWYRPVLGPNDRTMVDLKALYKTAGHIAAFVWISRGFRRDEGGDLKEAFVNRLMIENGLARVDRTCRFRRAGDRDTFLAFEDDARGRRAGLWR